MSGSEFVETVKENGRNAKAIQSSKQNSFPQFAKTALPVVTELKNENAMSNTFYEEKDCAFGVVLIYLADCLELLIFGIIACQ